MSHVALRIASTGIDEWFRLSSHILLYLGCLYVCGRLVHHLLLPKPLSGIPFDPEATHSVLGDFAAVRKCTKRGGSLTVYWAELATARGPLVQSFLTRFFPVVVLSDYQEIEDILTKRTHEFDRPTWFRQYFGNVTPTAQSALPTNGMLKRHRRIVGQAMGQPFLSRSAGRIARAAADLVALWHHKMQHAQGSPFDIKEDLIIALIDQSFDVAFDCQLRELQAYQRQINKPRRFNQCGGIDNWGFQRSALSMAVTEVTAASAQLRPDLHHRFRRANRPSWRAARKTVLGWMDRRIAEAIKAVDQQDVRSSETKAESVLEMLIQESRKSTNNALPPNEMRDELFQFGVAGGDTTRIALTFAVKLLSRNPAVQHKLRQVLTDHLQPISECLPTFEEVSDPALAYLDAVVYEVLRCSCIAAGTLRVATEDTQVIGYAIPKGTTLYLNFRGNMAGTAPHFRTTDHLRHSHWDDGDIFRPERWIDANGQFSSRNGPWLVFSAGPRACFGKNLAMLSVKMFIVVISMSFFLDTIPPELDTDRMKETHIREPVETYIRPCQWEDVEFR